jgi:hypothetical protein
MICVLQNSAHLLRMKHSAGDEHLRQFRSATNFIRNKDVYSRNSREMTAAQPVAIGRTEIGNLRGLSSRAAPVKSADILNIINHRMSTKEIEMNTHKPLYALASVLALSGALAGCATLGKSGLGGSPDDAKITADVQTRLQQDPATSPPDSIYVQTTNHVVYLSGSTDTRIEKDEAEADARQSPGVTDVVNTIVGHEP